MEKNAPRFSFSFARIYCSIFGHRFKISNFITNHIKEYKCSCCGKEMTDTAQGFIAKLTPKFRETNAYLAKIHQRRKRKRKTLSKAS